MIVFPRVDPPDTTLVENPDGRVQRRTGGVGAATVDRHLTGPTEEPALHRALHTGPGEIFTLRDEGDASAHHENQEERVDDCPMVAGENHRPFLGMWC